MNLYVIKHTEDEADLCSLEMEMLFRVNDSKNYFIVEDYIDVNRSPFVKYCIRNILISDTFENLITHIHINKISYENFKIKYLDIDNSMEFNKRHEIEGIIGYEIKGLARVSDPDIVLGISCIDNKWILGEYLKNKGMWREHNSRPRQYCNALTTRNSRAIVNIAVENSMDRRLIDPCCGIGTVVMEALSMGLDIVGYDINENVVEGARKNLDFFGYPDVIKHGNIHDLNDHFDIAIIDLPYGILSISSRNDQIEIIRSGSKLADKIAVISAYNIEEEFADLKLEVIKKCIISKGKFKRHLYICIKKAEL